MVWDHNQVGCLFPGTSVLWGITWGVSGMVDAGSGALVCVHTGLLCCQAPIVYLYTYPLIPRKPSLDRDRASMAIQYRKHSF